MTRVPAIPLRPHHGLCLGFFRGKGYSEEFVHNMTRVAASLAAEDPVICLTPGPDALCRACPRRQGDGCADGEKPLRYDAAVLSLCGLEPGAYLRWSAFRALLRARVLEPGLLGEVCGDCQWAENCSAPASLGCGTEG